jgi:hypothetical protein
VSFILLIIHREKSVDEFRVLEIDSWRCSLRQVEERGA